MDSIFVLTKTNLEFFKKPSLETCMEIIGNAPYWHVVNRICWHYGEPQFILHNNLVWKGNPDNYKDYFHVTNPKKPLYAQSHYSAPELRTMALQLGLNDTGTKPELYTQISNVLKMNIN
jgi:hypothetical protein